MFFFFNDTATTEIYTLSLHDALPIFKAGGKFRRRAELDAAAEPLEVGDALQAVLARDRKSTRLNSSHLVISYAVFCLKKKNKILSRSPPRPTLQRHVSERLRRPHSSQ